MGKYPNQKKIAAAADYCAGHHGLREVVRRHKVDVSSLRLWAAAYRVHGAAGVRTKRRKFYSAQFKLSVLQRMRTEKLSYRQVAALFNIRNRDMIGLWQRADEFGGVAALHPHSGIRHTAMTKQSDVESDGKDAEDYARTREELLEELHQLRMENAYLKKTEGLGSGSSGASARQRAKVVQELRQQFPLADLLRLASLARSSFYYQQQRLRLSDKYASLEARIRSIFERYQGRDGYRRITAAIRREGTRVNHKAIQRLMNRASSRVFGLRNIRHFMARSAVLRLRTLFRGKTPTREMGYGRD
jgi:putative transposase